MNRELGIQQSGDQISRADMVGAFQMPYERVWRNSLTAVILIGSALARIAVNACNRVATEETVEKVGVPELSNNILTHRHFLNKLSS